MAEDDEHERNKATSGDHKGNAPRHQGGDHERKAQQWSGGSKAAKVPVTDSDRHNPNSSAKT